MDDFKRLAGKFTDSLPGVTTKSYNAVLNALHNYFENEKYNPDPERDLGGRYRLTQLKEIVADYIASKPDSRKNAMGALMDSINERFSAFSALEVEVPKAIHFVWLGKLGQIQQDYIKAWGAVNGGENGYKIKVWYDPDALLAHALGAKIKQKAREAAVLQRPQGVSEIEYLRSNEFITDSITEVLRLQNKAYSKIKAEVGAGRTFDDVAAGFMNTVLRVDSAEINGIRQGNQKSYDDFIAAAGADYELIDVNDVLSGSTIDKSNYYLELGLRQNLAAASDIARLDILENQGGVYLDADLLPAFNQQLRELAGTLKISESPPKKGAPSRHEYDRKLQIVTELVTEHLSSEFPGRDARKGSYSSEVNQYADLSPEHAASIDKLRTSIANMGNKYQDFFEGLGLPFTHK